MNEFIYAFPLEQKFWNETGKGKEQMPASLTLASPAHPQVTRPLQTSLHSSTPVLLPAQLEGPAWPLSSSAVGIRFDICGDPRAEQENAMRNWLQLNI